MEEIENYLDNFLNSNNLLKTDNILNLDSINEQTGGASNVVTPNSSLENVEKTKKKSSLIGSAKSYASKKVENIDKMYQNTFDAEERKKRRQMIRNVGYKYGLKGLLGMFKLSYGLVYYIAITVLLYFVIKYIFKIYKAYPRRFTLSKTINIAHKYDKSIGLDSELAEVLSENIVNFIKYPSEIKNIINTKLKTYTKIESGDLNSVLDNFEDQLVNNYITNDVMVLPKLLLAFYKNKDIIFINDNVQDIDMNNETLFRNNYAKELISEINNEGINVKGRKYLLHFYKNLINDDVTFKISLNNDIINDNAVNKFYEELNKSIDDINYISCNSGNLDNYKKMTKINFSDSTIYNDDRMKNDFKKILLGTSDLNDSNIDTFEKYKLLFYRSVLYKILYENKSNINSILVKFNNKNPLNYILNVPSDIKNETKSNKVKTFYEDNSPYSIYYDYLKINNNHIYNLINDEKIIDINTKYKSIKKDEILVDNKDVTDIELDILNKIHNIFSINDNNLYNKFNDTSDNDSTRYYNLIQYLNFLRKNRNNEFNINNVIDDFFIVKDINENINGNRDIKQKLKNCNNFKKLYSILTNKSDNTINDTITKKKYLFNFINVEQKEFNRKNNELEKSKYLFDTLKDNINLIPKNRDLVKKKYLLTSIVFHFNYCLKYLNNNLEKIILLDFTNKNNINSLNSIFILFYTLLFKIIGLKYRNELIFSNSNIQDDISNTDNSLTDELPYITTQIKTIIVYINYLKNKDLINNCYFLNLILNNDDLRKIKDYYMSIFEIQLGTNYIEDTLEYRKKHLGINLNDITKELTSPFYKYINDIWKLAMIKYSINGGVKISDNILKVLKNLRDGKNENFNNNYNNKNNKEKDNKNNKETREKFIGKILSPIKKIVKAFKAIVNFVNEFIKLIEMALKFFSDPINTIIRLIIQLVIIVMSIPLTFVLVAIFIVFMYTGLTSLYSFLFLMIMIVIIIALETAHNNENGLTVMNFIGIMIVWLGTILYCLSFTGIMFIIIFIIMVILSIVYALDMSSKNKFSRFLYKKFIACENEPASWYKNSRYELNNFNVKGTLCNLKCGTNHKLSDDGFSCKLSSNNIPYYCPQPYIFRNYKKEKEIGTNYIRDFSNGLFTTRNRDYENYIKYLDDVEKYLNTCSTTETKRKKQYDIIAKSICASGVDNSDQDIHRKLNNMCNTNYCNNGKYEDFCYMYPNIEKSMGNNLNNKIQTKLNNTKDIVIKNIYKLIVVIILVLVVIGFKKLLDSKKK
jgi:hypothetical protein